MSVIFLSHSSSDKRAAENLRVGLLGAGYASVFIDNHGITPGQFWEPVLYERLRAARAVVAFVTRRFIESPWCFAEITHARALGRPIVPVLGEQCDLPPILKDYQAQRADEPLAVNRIVAGLASLGVRPHDDLDWDGSRPPYPGLNSFQVEDAGVYFGREDEVHRALDALHDIEFFGGTSVLLILGGSGTGKSSFMRAGVLSRILSEGKWRVVGPMRPGDKPFDQLQKCLRDAHIDSAAGIDAGPKGRNSSSPILLTIDQLEELVSANVQESSNFVDWMNTAIPSPSPIYLLATLRSDYLSDFERLLPKLIGAARHFTLGKMDEEGLLRAIERPAEVSGIKLEEGLSREILRDVRDRNALPLLAFTLRGLWERRSQGTSITRNTYRNELGAVSGAIRRAATAAVGQIPVADVPALRSALLRMVHLAPEGRVMRRRVSRLELPESASSAINALVTARLLVIDGDYIEPAHESLYEIWQQLHEWVVEAHSALIVRGEVETVAEQWNTRFRGTEYLWPRARLERTSALLAASQITPSVLGSAFLEASWKQVNETEVMERTRQIAEVKRLRRQRIIVSIALVAVTSAAVFALQSRYRATRSADLARASQQAMTVELAATGVERDPTESVRLLLQLPAESSSWRAARIVAADATAQGIATEIPIVGSQPSALSFSPSGEHIAIGRRDGSVELRSVSHVESLVQQRVHAGGISDLAFTVDGNIILTAGADRSLKSWNVKTGSMEKLHQCGSAPEESGTVDYFLVRASHLSRFAFASTAPCGLTVVDFDGGKRIVRSIGPSDLPAWGGIALSSGGSYLAVRTPNSVLVYETAHGRLMREISFKSGQDMRSARRSVSSFSFTSDERYAVVSAFNGDRLVWEIGKADRQYAERRDDCSGNTAMAVSPKTDVVASDANEGRALCVWRADDAEYSEHLKFDRVERDTGDTYVGRRNIAFDSSGTLVVSPSSSEDNSLRLWNLVSGEKFVLRGHKGTVRSAVFSPQGNLVASSSYDGTVRIWHIGGLGRAEISAPLTLSKWGRAMGTRVPVTISRDGRLVAYASGGGAFDSEDSHVPVWTPERKEVATLGGWAGWSGSSAFDPSGKRLAVSSTTVTAQGKSKVSSSESSISLAEIDSREVRLLGKHPAAFADVDWSRDGRWITSSGGNRLILWDVMTGARSDLIDNSWNCNDVRSRFAAGTGMLMVVCDDRVRFIDIQSRVFQEKSLGESISHFALGSKGDLFAIHRGHSIEIWSTRPNLRRLHILRGHESEIRALSFSPDDTQLVSSGKESVWLWDTREGRGRRFDAPVFEPTVLGFLTDGRIVGAGNTSYYIWRDQLPRDPASLIKQLWSVARPDVSH